MANDTAPAATGTPATSTPAASAPAAPSASGSMAPAAAPASTPAATNTGTPAAGSAPVADWMAGLKDETRGFVTNKGWKAPGDVLESYQNLEKLVGAPQDKLIKIPTDESDSEGWNNVFSKLGRPQTPADYKIEAPKEGGSPEFAKWAADNFHAAGLSTKQAGVLLNKWNEFQAGAKSAMDQQTIQKLTQGQEAVKKEWGAAYEQNVKVAARAARENGIDKAALDKIESAIGFDGVMKLFHSIGAKTGESSFVSGEMSGGALTPAQAQDQKSALMQDKGFIQKYTSGDADAIRKMHNLEQMIHAGEQGL